MKFEATVQNQEYTFTSINSTSFLVSGKSGEYILYKTKKWNCADDVPKEFIQKLGAVIDEELAHHNTVR